MKVKSSWFGVVVVFIVLLILAFIKTNKQNNVLEKISQGYIDFGAKMSQQMAKEQQKKQAEKEKK